MIAGMITGPDEAEDSVPTELSSEMIVVLPMGIGATASLVDLD